MDLASHRTASEVESPYRQHERGRLEGMGLILEDIGFDSCGIICSIRKVGAATHGNVKRALGSLAQMAHRSGEVHGEGDGCGVLTDIPRRLWRETLAASSLDQDVVASPSFWVGHYFIPQDVNPREALDHLRVLAGRFGARVLLERRGLTQSSVLGPAGALTEPLFYQVAGIVEGATDAERGRALYRLAVSLEAGAPVHVVSQSCHTVVYKVRGSAEILDRYYPELRRPEFESVATIGHNRYSTNTMSTFEQVQPFSLLGHNGEINTIDRLRAEGQALGVTLTGGSDSQDLNRILESLVHEQGLSLLEALELAFPPVLGEVKGFSPALQDAYMGLRQAFGPLAQGPAALVTRLGSECVFSVDALGLRPLWFGETEKEFFWSSERGVVPLGAFIGDPRPMAPGEKMLATLRTGSITPMQHHDAQRLTLERAHNREAVPSHARRHLNGPQDLPGGAPSVQPAAGIDATPALRALYGWEKWDETYLAAIIERGAEPISSLGFDGPLAALRTPIPNLAEFFKETVAVVTNPAVDREREIEQFSTRGILGRRPLPNGSDGGATVELVSPILAPDSEMASSRCTLTLAQVPLAVKSETLDCSFGECEILTEALDRLGARALQAAQDGAECIILSDVPTHVTAGRIPLDPLLSLAAVERALTRRDPAGVSWRRRTSLVLSSGGLRNLHDLMLAFGSGANAVDPWLIFATAGADATGKVLDTLTKGLEKVLSTMGIHELRGYGRVFSALGLQPDLSDYLGVRSFLAGPGVGVSFTHLEASARARRAAFDDGQGAPERDVRLNGRVYKAAAAAARGETNHADYTARVRSLEYEFPVAGRHLLEVRGLNGPSNLEGQRLAEEVDLGVGGHSLPFVFSAMSFGSQGETAFRSYPEAAKRLNMVSMNGEGGEIGDMIGRYNRWRGQQVASGRFGVSAEMLNSCAFIEIKIGQGAKPGEGGHLPAAKVTHKVAAARRSSVGVDLISPSNNHDLYSIEDLAQLVEELKTVNPQARVVVKVPVVPGLGTIAVGIAKAGADVINISGFEGGTGAARAHALKYAGLPAELGLRAAHRALVLSGLRDRVEVWVDGGMKTALDVIKMVALGANRVGFGTMAMAAMGCTICRGCQLDTCHVGIATQVETQEEAQAKGMKRFEPRELDLAVSHLTAFFSGMAADLRAMLATLGIERLQDAVGRTELLAQIAGHDRLELSGLLEAIPAQALARQGVARVIRKPLNSLTRMVSTWVAEAALAGDERLVYRDGPVASADRALGTHLSGELSRRRADPRLRLERVRLHFDAGSIPGNGLGAFNADPVEILVDGGAQDGVGKGASSGRITILKGLNDQGARVDGSVGKSFAYGATGGSFLVQGNADSRFCIRLSGADVVLGGEINQPLQDDLGMLAARANAKGFAFEYMTAGRVVVLGDPGPWICSGMTGGVVYLRLQPNLGLDDNALKNRLARGAGVRIHPLGERGVLDVRELLGKYHAALTASEQVDAARRIAELLVAPAANFRMVLPAGQSPADAESTE